MTGIKEDQQYDPVILGHQVRYYRREAKLTLAQLGTRVGKPPSYLSQLENGHLEPRLGTLATIARVLNVATSDLLDTEAPTYRAKLEIRLAKLQAGHWPETLGLPVLRPGAKVDDDILATLVALYEALPEAVTISDVFSRQRANVEARIANLALRTEMRERGNYFSEIEAVAAETLAASGYMGEGPPSEKHLTDLVAHYGFRVERVKGMPITARSVTDKESRIIYIPQRDDLSVRASRSVILQTLGHFALQHQETTDFDGYLRQRVESNYFAAAVLIPEDAATVFLRLALQEGDLSIEDLKERYYVSYEMAAHRFTNLATKHLDLQVHFLRTDPAGTITKAYENDGLVFPSDQDGGLEGVRVSRLWGARQAWAGSDIIHEQFTSTDEGDFWCATYVENVAEGTPFAITIGCQSSDAKVFRGGDTVRRVAARRQDLAADPKMVDRWAGVAWPSAAERSFVLTALPPADREFSPFPGIDLVDVYRFLERQSGG